MHRSLQFNGKSLDLSSPCLCAILNATPDSFSDGGASITELVNRAISAQNAGAGLLDLGAVSTRPNATPVSPDLEWARLEPALRAVQAASNLPISIDTTTPEVAARALELGADLLNDVSGDPPNEIFEIAAQHHAGLILMRNGRNSPLPQENLPEVVARDLLVLAEKAMAHGVPAQNIALDPGLGFTTSVPEDLRLAQSIAKLRQLPEIAQFPLFVGPSRKRFLGPQLSPLEREPATVVAAAHFAACGVEILRLHSIIGVRAAIELRLEAA